MRNEKSAYLFTYNNILEITLIQSVQTNTYNNQVLIIRALRFRSLRDLCMFVTLRNTINGRFAALPSSKNNSHKYVKPVSKLHIFN